MSASSHRPAVVWVWADLERGVHYHPFISCPFVGEDYSRITLDDAQRRRLRYHSCAQVKRGTLLGRPFVRSSF
jgi:hypothetical protein